MHFCMFVSETLCGILKIYRITHDDRVGGSIFCVPRRFQVFFSNPNESMRLVHTSFVFMGSLSFQWPFRLISAHASVHL